MPRLAIQERNGVRNVSTAAVLALTLLWIATVLHYRNTVERLFDERQAEADAVALHIARALEGGDSLPHESQLRRLAGTAKTVAVYSDDRSVRVGEIEDPDDVIIGRAPLSSSGGPAAVEAALDASELLGRRRTVRLWTPISLVAAGVILMIFLLFSRRLPERPDQGSNDTPTTRDEPRPNDRPEDEIRQVMSNVERALSAINAREAPVTTELISLQKALERSLSLIGELSAGVAHEMRNSLATLRGYLTLLEQAEEGEPLDEYIGELRRETDHLKRVLDDFLTFARPGSARMQEVEVVPVIHRAGADPALDAFPVRVRFEDAESLRVMGDEQLLERALRNLLLNAVQAQRGVDLDAPLHVLAREAADCVEILVEDRGPGISEDVRERLFHPFATGRQDGVGLGLALTQRIVELHQGTLALEDREGGGTRARLLLPGANATKSNIRPSVLGALYPDSSS